MAYRIDVSYMENQQLSEVTIYGQSEHSKSARISQFQRIGWILEIKKEVEVVTQEEYLVNPDYAEEALARIGGITQDEARMLLSKKGWREVFEYTWSILPQKERDMAIRMDYQFYDNYWPGFEFYNCTFHAMLSATETISATRF